VAVGSWPVGSRWMNHLSPVTRRGGQNGRLAGPAERGPGDAGAAGRAVETAAQGAGSLADSTSQVTADVRPAAEWTGDAADGYTAFTGNLARGVSGTGPGRR
jgi:hypothetical protein